VAGNGWVVEIVASVVYDMGEGIGSCGTPFFMRRGLVQFSWNIVLLRWGMPEHRGGTDEGTRYRRRMTVTFIGALFGIALLGAIFLLVAYMFVPL
jgi:hypothetical protein